MECLVHGAENSDSGLQSLLTKPDVDVNAVVDSSSGRGSTALIAACTQGYVRNVAALVADPRTDVNKPGTYVLPLVIAAERSLGCVKALLEHDSIDVNARNPYDNSSALRVAALSGHIDIVRVLLEAGAHDEEAICPPSEMRPPEDERPSCSWGDTAPVVDYEGVAALLCRAQSE